MSYSDDPSRFTAGGISQSQNRLLRALPADECVRISQYLQSIRMPMRHVFLKEGEKIRDVYFPGGGTLSLTKTFQDGKTAEVATVGSEGMFGSGVFFGDELSPGDVFVQVPHAEAHKMSVEAFVMEMERRGALYNRVVRYSQALTSQIMQTTVCNGLHSAEQRLSRWLLMTHDRVKEDEFELTHDFLAIMLGVRRATVTLVAAKLRLLGLISYRRGFVAITDRAGLEKTTCECYEAVRGTFRRLMPEMPPVG